MALTLSMIVRNEAELLPQCLKSVRDFVDGIIICDTGSTDGTQEIARELGATVHQFEWCDDFSAARNFALSLVETPWTLFLDADDLVLNPEILPEIKEKAHKDRANGIWSIYRQDASSYQRRLQLFKTKDYKWEGVVHESAQPKNPTRAATVLSDLVVLHRKPIERCPEAALKYLGILLAKDTNNWIGLAESYKYLSAHPDDQAKHRHYLEQADHNYYQAFKWDQTNDPTKYICLFNMAWLNLELASYDSKFTLMAKRLAQLGVGTEPHRAECWVVLGQANQARGNLSEAAQCYDRAMQLTPPTDSIGLVYQEYYKTVPAKLLTTLQEQIAQKQALERRDTDINLWTPH